MNVFRTWLLSVTVTALSGSLMLALVPEGSVKKIAAFTASLLLVFAALTPLAGLDEESLLRSVTRLRLDAEQVRTGVEIRNRELQQRIIKEQAETYILDKARSMGLPLQAEVHVEDAASGLCITGVTLTGAPTAAQLAQLGAFIRDNLGLSAERQVWKTP